MMFVYKAVSHDGTITKGLIEAQNVGEAATFLRNKSLIPVEIDKQKQKGALSPLTLFKRNSLSDLVLFTRQLSSMLTSGLTLMQSLLILKEQTQNPRIREVVNGIIEQVEEGKPLAFAIEKYPDIFSPIYIALIRAGESSGFLDKILLRLAENLEKQQKLRSTIRSALMYPAIIIVLMIAVTFVMMIFVIPPLSNLYTSLNVTLPLTTQVVIGISNFTIKFWWLVLGVSILLIYTLRYWSKTESGSLIIDDLILKVPIIGNLVRKTVLAEFSRTLGLLVGSGALVVQSLQESANVADNRIYRGAITEIAKRVEKGISIGDAMAVYTLFPPILVQMVKIGEQTGKLDESLIKVSEYFEREVDTLVKGLTTAIEPIIMLILGVGVAFLVTSIITPIYSITNAIK
jgi:type IV pilus assembly protein PilC